MQINLIYIIWTSLLMSNTTFKRLKRLEDKMFLNETVNE